MWRTWISRDDCGLAHVSPDELSLVYSLVSDSSLSMAVQGTEQPGIFLTAALLSQSCLQNTRWWDIFAELSFNSSMIFFCRCVYKGRDNKLFLYAATNIKKGEKLCHSWAKNLLFSPTNERQKMLRDLFINCQCLRCLDASEMGTNLRWMRLIFLCILMLTLDLSFVFAAGSIARDARELFYLCSLLTRARIGAVINVSLIILDTS